MRGARLVVGLAAAGLLACGALVVAASCPLALARLMPKGAVDVSGQYQTSGAVGMGGASAHLPFQHPCTRGDPYPGHIILDVRHYGDPRVFAMQADAVAAQTIEDDTAEYARRRDKVQKETNSLDRISEVKTESASDGRLVYFDFYVDCSVRVKRSHPYAYLTAVKHTESTLLTITIEGWISAEAARNAAIEVMGKLRDADFSSMR